MSRTLRLACELATRLAAYLDENPSRPRELEDLLTRLREEYPGLRLNAYEARSGNYIELTEIEAPVKGQGIGTEVIREIQGYARSVGKPIVLRPHPEPRKKEALMRFYRNLGFVVNKGRNTDYTLSSPMALTMYWRP